MTKKQARIAQERIQASQKKTFQKIIAVDFDGTLCANRYPDIGSPRTATIQALKAEQDNGAALILWSCRSGEKLEEAVRWCSRYGLYFDAINANLPGTIDNFGCDPRKVYAHVYLDDRSTRKL